MKKTDSVDNKTKSRTSKVSKIDMNLVEPIDKQTKVVHESKDEKSSLIDFFRTKNYTAVILIGIAIFVFMVIISAQLNTVGNTNVISKGMREAELLSELANSKEKYEQLKKDYDESQEIVEEYKTSASNNDALIASLTSDLNAASMLAGLTNVRGEGIVITLSDSTSITADLSVEAGLVHDTDLTSILTELKAAGAEAISINGQRIIATTAIRCVGPTIQVNSVKVASPFEIKAIGNAQYLESALNIKGGIVASLKSYGINIEVKRSDNVQINKYDGTFRLSESTEVR